VSGEDFDNLTIALANRSISRRRALQLAAASALGAAGIGVAAREAEARPTCPRRTGCTRRCRNTSKVCSCIRTTGGNRVCVHQCCSQVACASSSDCGENEVCMRSGCCNEGQKTCVTRCSAPAPDYCDVEEVSTSSTSWS
jgi:hypothetical protein